MKYKTVTSENFQMSIIEIEQLVKENEYRKKIENRINLIGKEIYPNYKNHNIYHAKNTALLSLIISNYANISENDVNLVIDAALLHDIGRVNDLDDEEHGKNGVQIAYTIKKNDNYYTGEKLKMLFALIEGHTHELYDRYIIEKYRITDYLTYEKLLRIIKDADIVDRIRLSNNPLIELEKLNFDISRKLFLYAKQLNSQKEITVNSKSKEDMIIRINEFLSLHRQEFTKEEFIDMKRLLMRLTKTEIYSKQALKEYENRFLKYYTKIWKKSLSEFKDYKENENFKFLITCPTVRVEKYQMKPIISASLISDQHMGTFNKIPIGIVLEIEDESILGISEKDMHSLILKPNETMDSYYLNSIGANKIYAKMETMSLKTPKEIEVASIQENIKENGNILLLGKHSVYNDILLDGKKVKAQGIVIIEPCDQMWIEEAHKLASKFGLQIKSIYCQHYYNKLGLNLGLNNENKLEVDYCIYDLCVLESILNGTSNINEAHNLFVQQVGKNFYIKSYESKDYIFYKPNERVINFIKKKDNVMITLSFDGLKFSYFEDKNAISREEMASILEEAKESSKSSNYKKI